MKREIEKVEDIYPLSIVKTRFGKIVILNADVDAGEGSFDMSWADYIQGVDDVQYDVNDWMIKNVEPCLYGIGNTILEAFDDYKERLLNAEDRVEKMMKELSKYV
jgi:hypothetical protein